jgi:hypothetical protein
MFMNEITSICQTVRKRQTANELQLTAIQHNKSTRTGEGTFGNLRHLRWTVDLGREGGWTGARKLIPRRKLRCCR